MTVSANINSQSTANKSLSEKISYVKTTATDAQIKTFAQSANSLTTNTYIDTTKVTTEVIN